MVVKTFKVDGLSSGIYVYTFEVYDEAGLYDSDTVMVTVLPATNQNISFGDL